MKGKQLVFAGVFLAALTALEINQSVQTYRILVMQESSTEALAAQLEVVARNTARIEENSRENEKMVEELRRLSFIVAQIRDDIRKAKEAVRR